MCGIAFQKEGERGKILLQYICVFSYEKGISVQNDINMQIIL